MNILDDRLVGLSLHKTQYKSFVEQELYIMVLITFFSELFVEEFKFGGHLSNETVQTGKADSHLLYWTFSITQYGR